MSLKVKLTIVIVWIRRTRKKGRASEGGTYEDLHSLDLDDSNDT